MKIHGNTLADLGKGRQDIFLINMKYFTIQLFLVHGTFCSNSFFHRFFAVKKYRKKHFRHQLDHQRRYKFLTLPLNSLHGCNLNLPVILAHKSGCNGIKY